ncbi:MAG: ABC transporter permease [Deltaproteobacteria bacterium]|nr:ABC transporter permease [Deltaproteobacteria bacterium]
MFKNENVRKLLWPAVALLVILLFNVFFTENFLNIEVKDGHLFGSLIDILNRGAPVLIISIGMTLVYATGGIDLSVGSVIAISGAVAAQLIRPGYIHGILEYPDPPTSLFVVIGVPLLICAIAGAWNGVLVAFVGIQPIIATLILMVAGRGIAQLVTEGQIPVFIHEPFQFLGGGFLMGVPFPVIVSILLIAAVYFLTRRTSLGLFIESSGGNPIASRYMGIKSRLIVLSTYVFCALCAGLAGLIICSDIKAADANNAGLFLELDAIAAVIIGGTMWGGRFTLAGSVIGALIIQSITTTILAFGIPPEVTLVFKALVIIIVSLIQSEGIQDAINTWKTKRAQA